LLHAFKHPTELFFYFVLFDFVIDSLFLKGKGLALLKMPKETNAIKNKQAVMHYENSIFV